MKECIANKAIVKEVMSDVGETYDAEELSPQMPLSFMRIAVPHKLFISMNLLSL